MGKGLIMSGGTNGEYQVQINYAYRSRIEQKIVTLNQSKTKLQDRLTQIENDIAGESDPEKLEDLNFQRSVTKLQIAAIDKDIEYYQTGMPPDATVAAWCADLTEDLSGYVGTIEIPGEPAQILIRPGYDGRAIFSAARDGQLMPPIAGAPWQCLLNKMLLPGWQRHKPIYRIGTIESIDYSANTATVCLDPAFSSQQYLPAVDGVDDSGCSAENPVEAQIADFCSRNPGHPLCTNTEAGEPINLTDGQLAQLQAVNQSVNQEFGRDQDKSGYRLGDSWDVLTGGDKGDCEDFALTKMQRLVASYGWNPRDLKVITAYVPHLGEYHAMLAVRTTNRGLVILDVNNDAVLQNGKTPYRLHRIALTKEDWTAISRKVEGATVEYMTCNAGAFVAGDRVVVEFPNQNYTTAKVIGFEQAPTGCESTVFTLCRYQYGPTIGFVGYNILFDTIEWAFVNFGLMPAPYTGRYRVGGAQIGKNIYCVGGINWQTGSPPWERISANTEFATAYLTYATKQAIPLAREGLSGFGYNGKAWFTGGINLGILNFIGDNSYGTGIYRRWCLFDCWENYYNEFDPALEARGRNDEYTLTEDAWATRRSMGTDRGFARGFGIAGQYFVMGGVVGKRDSITDCKCCIYIYEDGSRIEQDTRYYGEWINLSAASERYDPESDSWAGRQSLASSRAAYGAASVGLNGFVFQGNTESKLTSDDLAEVGAPAEADSIPTPGSGYGGCDEREEEIYRTYSAAKYNSDANAWSAIQSLPNNGVGGPDAADVRERDRDNLGTGLVEGSGYPAVATNDGKIVVCQLNQLGSGSGPVYEYTIETNSYVARGSREELLAENENHSRAFGSVGYAA